MQNEPTANPFGAASERRGIGHTLGRSGPPAEKSGIDRFPDSGLIGLLRNPQLDFALLKRARR